MLVLRNTTSTITAQAGGDPGADVPVYVGFVEENDSAKLSAPGVSSPQYQTSKMATGGTTKITALSAPAANKRRLVKSILFKNVSASSIAYTFRFEDSAATVAAVLLMTVTLAAGECGQYIDGQGWTFFSTAGHVK